MRKALLVLAMTLAALTLPGCGGGIGEDCLEDADCAVGLSCENVKQCVTTPCDGAWQCRPAIRAN